MSTYNKVFLIGRLTADPEPPRSVNGSSVVSFRFAVGRSRKNAQTGQWESDPNPMYIDAEAWTNQDGTGPGRLVTEHCRKGKELFLEGELKFEQWEDKNNPGQKRSKHKIRVLSIQFLGGREDEGGEPQTNTGYGSPKTNTGYGGAGDDGPKRTDYGKPGNTGGGRGYTPLDHGNNPPVTDDDGSGIPF